MSKQSWDKDRRVAEKVLGMPLPPNCEIHHFKNVLVVCEDREYHRLLHSRERALKACGHANWRKCIFCKEWGPLEDMKIQMRSSRPGSHSYHKACKADYARERYYLKIEKDHNCRTV